MKETFKFLLIAAAIVGGTFAGRVYNHVVLDNLAADTELVAAAPIKSYSARVLVDTDKFTDIATGNLIRSDMILTNWHALRSFEKGAKLIVELADGTSVSATVLKKDQDKDLALLELSKPTILPNLGLAPLNPVKGQQLSASGFAKGHEYREVTGKVVGFNSSTKGTKNNLFLMDCCVVGGMSGSAALDGNGQLAGVIFGCKDVYTYGANVDTVREFLDGTKYWEN